MMGTALPRVYVIVTGASGEVVACRYLNREDVPSWLTSKAGAASVRCDVFDEAPVCGGTRLTTFLPSGHAWREQHTR